MRMILGAVLFGFALAATSVAAQDRTVTVTGDGRVAAVPDIAHVRVGVATDAGTAAEALASNSAAMQEVIDRLLDEGIEDRDMQTSTLDIGPRYSQGTDNVPRPDGFTARNVLTLRVRDLDRLGDVLDAIAQEGANTFEGLSFGISEPRPLHDEALRTAVADARRKAELLAEEAGVALGEVRVIDTAGGPQPRPMEMVTARMAADSVPVARGELEVAASVTMVFALAD